MKNLIYFFILFTLLILNTGLKAKQLGYSNSSAPDSTLNIKIGTLPKSQVFLGGYSGDGNSISKAELDTVRRIYVKLNDTLMKEGINYTIVEYFLAVAKKGGGAYVFNCSGNKISNELHSLFEKVEAGDIIAIRDVTINTFYGKKQIFGGSWHVK